MLIHLTPVGPMMVLARQGDPEKVSFLCRALPSRWRDSLLARFVLGIAFDRAGDILGGQGMANLPEAVQHWKQALSQRSQKGRVTWSRMERLVGKWLPPARIYHPHPSERLRVTTRGKSPVR